jgi:hypothetical protein
LALALPSDAVEKGGHPVAHRSIEILIGRLITDETFRTAFVRDASSTLTEFRDVGYDLTPVEITALTATRADLWARVADQLDPRLQKAFFRRGVNVEKQR